jgi:ATP-dependent DNA helicase 2 subunit 2
MTEKEAKVFIVDVGESLTHCNNGRTETDLDWSLRYFWDRISEIVSLNRKTICVGVVGLRTDETSSLMEDEPGYEHIAVLRHISGPLDLQGMKALQQLIKPGTQLTGDAISAIALAIRLIQDFTKKLKYKREITLITDGLGFIDMDEEDIQAIADQLNQSEISLKVLYVVRSWMELDL